jgi:hypothetical protein
MDQTRCSFLEQPFEMSRPSFNLSNVEASYHYEPQVAEQSELSVEIEDIPAETNALDQHDAKTSLVKPGTNL